MYLYTVNCNVVTIQYGMYMIRKRFNVIQTPKTQTNIFRPDEIILSRHYKLDIFLALLVEVRLCKLQIKIFYKIRQILPPLMDCIVLNSRWTNRYYKEQIIIQ